jgi:hypothetical protein
VADRILEALRDGEELTRTEISVELFQRHQSADRIEAALHLLARLGLARAEVRATNGRPVEIWISSAEPAK